MESVCSTTFKTKVSELDLIKEVSPFVSVLSWRSTDWYLNTSPLSQYATICTEPSGRSWAKEDRHRKARTRVSRVFFMILIVSVPNIGIIQFISNRIRHSTVVGVMWKGAGVESTPRRPLSRHKPWLFASAPGLSLFRRAPNSLIHSNILKTNRLFWPICFQDIIDTPSLDCPAFSLMPGRDRALLSLG